METRFLETFVADVDGGSYAEAGRRLELSAAAVAQRVHVLEDTLEVKLVVRLGRVVRPTESGYAVLQHARKILHEVETLQRLAGGDRLSGEIRVGAISTALTGMVPKALLHLAATTPELRLHLIPGTSIDLHRKLSDSEIEAAIIIKPPFELDKSLEWELLRVEPLVVIAGSETDVSDPLDLLRTRRFIRYDSSSWGGRLADAYLREIGIKPSEFLELDSLDAIAVMVSQGIGISLIPDWAPPWPQGVSVKRLKLPGQGPSRNVGLLWPRSSAYGLRIARLADALRHANEAT